MPQLVKKRRSGWAVLAVGALVASLFAVGASPATAAVEKQDRKAPTSACVGDALKDKMFTDVSEGHAFRDAINCLAYYGITEGTSADEDEGAKFSPSDVVSRQQMALFMARAARAAGVNLGDPKDAGYTDIEDAWPEARDDINRLGNMNIFPKGGAFRPSADMTRAEMAGALIGMLHLASPGVTRTATGAISLSVGTAAASVADDYFADVRAQSPAWIDRAAAALYELGVTKGSGMAAVLNPQAAPLDVNFNPGGTVNRGAMAAFITRAMAHTSVRPIGVSAQNVGNRIRISMRDDNFRPVPNKFVEVFWVNSAEEAQAISADGTCGRLVLRSGSGSAWDGNFPCEIESSDLLTLADGDALTQPITIGDAGIVIWAWSGDLNARVKSDTKLFKSKIDKPAPPPMPASTTKISVDGENVWGLGFEAPGATDAARTFTHRPRFRGKFGSPLTFTLQLQDAMGNNVTGGARDPGRPAQWLVSFDVHIRAAGVTGNLLTRSALPLKSDTEGKATFKLSPPPDPTPNAVGSEFEVRYTIAPDPRGCVDVVHPPFRPAVVANPNATPPIMAQPAVNPPGTTQTFAKACDAPWVAQAGVAKPAVPTPPVAKVTDGDPGGTMTNPTTGATPTAGDFSGAVVFTDAAKVASHLVIDAPTYVPIAARGATTNRAKVTLLDQYGDPVRAAPINLTSSNGQGTGGTAAIKQSSLNRTMAAAPITAVAAPRNFLTGADGSYTFAYTWTGGGASETLTAKFGTTVTKTKPVLWVSAPLAANAAGISVVKGGDVEKNHIVVEIANVPYLLVYVDGEDRLNTGTAAAAMPSTPATTAGFEKVLTRFLKDTDRAYQMVSWSNYSTTPRNVSVFTLHSTCLATPAPAMMTCP